MPASRAPKPQNPLTLSDFWWFNLKVIKMLQNRLQFLGRRIVTGVTTRGFARKIQVTSNFNKKNELMNKFMGMQLGQDIEEVRRQQQQEIIEKEQQRMVS